MRPIVRTSIFILLGLAAPALSSAPATAITAELANKCRLMAIKVYPPKPAGTKAGTAEAERKYFQECIKNEGRMPENTNQTSTPPAPKQ